MKQLPIRILVISLSATLVLLSVTHAEDYVSEDIPSNDILTKHLDK